MNLLGITFGKYQVLISSPNTFVPVKMGKHSSTILHHEKYPNNMITIFEAIIVSAVSLISYVVAKAFYTTYIKK
jgi:hypothetical protein